MSKIKLKHCPFCGSKDIQVFVIEDGVKRAINNEEEPDQGYPYIHCYGCDIDFLPPAGSCTYKETVESWNKRTPST